MFLRFILLFSLAVFGLSSTQAWARNITGVCMENSSPFCFENKGRPAGIYPDIYKELSVRLGTSVNVKVIPFKRMLLNLKQGSVDIAGPLFYTEERARSSSYFSTNIFEVKIILFGYDEPSFEFQNASDLYGKTIGKRRGYHLSDEVASAVKRGQIKVVEANSEEQLFNLLVKKRVKFIMVPEYLVILEQPNLPKGLANLGYVSTGTQLKMVLSRSADQYQEKDERISEALASMRADGTLERIIKKYLVPFD
ncbi:transporter substrate-binding domain-containing protein [Vibrio profundum]|uniref:transporter substrate-binding domain-containing protein n=1 Tax=Vibrio profundum TaxID=2910247 RepID=UPI003D0D5188